MSSECCNPRRRILIVDDQESIHDAYRTILRNQSSSKELDNLEDFLFAEPSGETKADSEEPIDFDLTHTHQGEQAVEAVRQATDHKQSFELAFVDMRMPPGMDGLETIEALWEIAPAMQIVICTAFSDYSWSEVTTRLGTKDNLLLLKKPFSNEEVLQLALALTEKHRVTLEKHQQLEDAERVNEELAFEIVQRKNAELQLKFLATHDAMTKLPNRRFLREALSHRIATREARPKSLDALVFLDLDNFKYVNDSLGHDVGDELLRQIAARTKQTLRDQNVDDALDQDGVLTERAATSCLVARLGGDEFVVFLTDLNDTQHGVDLSNAVLNGLTGSYDLDKHQVPVGVSLGIAFSDSDTQSPEQLMRNADLAMYHAKFSGKSCIAIFDEEMHKSATKRLELELALRGAVGRDELYLVHQPILDIQSGELCGFESLLRWAHDDLGLIYPIEFIPLSEECGLIVPVGYWILEDACQTVRAINESLPETSQIAISVNVSKRQLLDVDFVRRLGETLDRYELAGNELNIEITESVVMDSPEEIVERLFQIKELGVGLHMDDFGTGHSSLSCLHRFPIDVLKIDRSFVSTMDSKSDYESIIFAIITLAHNLNVKVIAEGIENEQQLARLRDLGCDYGQGFFFAKPKPFEEIAPLLQNMSIKSR